MPEAPSATVKPYLVVCLMAFAVFAGVAVGVQTGFPALVSVDTEVGQSLHDHQQESPGWTHFFELVKELAGLWAMIAGVVLVMALLALSGRYWLAVAWACAVEGAAFANDLVVKQIFKRERPPFNKIKPGDWSFPSGHSLRGFVMYGFLAYLIVYLLPRKWLRIVGVTVMVVVVGLIGFSRIYLGKHYLSDVIGGFAFGAGWLAAWIAVIEWMGWRHRRPVASETVAR